MKLYSVEVMDDYEFYYNLVVASSEREAEDKVIKMDWSCLMNCVAYEIDKVDGYKIKLEKIGE